MCFEECLIWNASPTLANIKIANLFNFKFASMKECKMTIRHFNFMMNPKGVYIELLKNVGDFYLIYVYRKNKLIKELQDAHIKSFLEEYGYSGINNLNEHFKILKNRLRKEKDFPHEIGVFLGYPLADVKTFIEMKGQNCVVCGDWKVYHDEQNARCTFCKYKHCRDVYVKVYGRGRKIHEMLVSA